MLRTRLILASTSSYRRELLARLGLDFECAAPSFEEPAAAGEVTEAAARARAEAHAQGKANSLRAAYPESLILGSDQVCHCDGRVLSKALTAERAREQLAYLSGREHHLYTSVCLLDAPSGAVEGETLVSSLRVRELSTREIADYVERERPLQSAGSYLSEGLGAALFEWMRGDDPTAIVGLPLTSVVRLLRRRGVAVLGDGAARRLG